ncbi:MAG: hydrogenase maturation protease [Gemmatimonadales bacterium]|nr:hydrogenase maturation protease [Gemmatimonadales bacterium]
MADRWLVLGLGNPILGDDGVGWHVADAVEQSLNGLSGTVMVERAALGGLHVMERLIGYDRAIILDAIHTGRHAVGRVSLLPLEDLPDPVAGYTNSSHDTSLRTALEVGRTLGARLPEHVTIVAVETTREYDFSEELSPSVRAAVPRAAALVLDTLDWTDPSLEEAHHGVH